MQTLTATKRSKTDKMGEVRNQGLIPAVIYGASVENTPIAVNSRDFIKLFKIAGESSAIVVELEGKKIDALVQEVQYEAVKGYPLHVDFLAIDASKPVTVSVELVFEGVSPAVKENLGSLVKVIHEVEVSALPKNLPQEIVVSIEKLVTLEDQIHVSDIILPKDVTMETDGEEVVALVAPQQEEKEEETPMDISSIEVEKKGKKDEEETPAE